METNKLTTKQIRAMKDKSFREKAIAEIAQALKNAKKGVFLF